ncbi:hypothetical protein BJ742DRAFT_786508 [Cladochytrium replicatum]|nr:hypothetical protein BJ742DRAFT_786508 [Cladochytrium replicatum]
MKSTATLLSLPNDVLANVLPNAFWLPEVTARQRAYPFETTHCDDGQMHLSLRELANTCRRLRSLLLPKALHDLRFKFDASAQHRMERRVRSPNHLLWHVRRLIVSSKNTFDDMRPVDERAMFHSLVSFLRLGISMPKLTSLIVRIELTDDFVRRSANPSADCLEFLRCIQAILMNGCRLQELRLNICAWSWPASVDVPWQSISDCIMSHANTLEVFRVALTFGSVKRPPNCAPFLRLLRDSKSLRVFDWDVWCQTEHEECGKHVAQALSKSPARLREFKLVWALDRPTTMAQIISSFENASCLEDVEVFVLSYVHIEEEAIVKKLSAALSSWTKLRRLDLSGLTVECDKRSLVRSLSENCNLSVLQLDDGSFINEWCMIDLIREFKARGSNISELSLREVNFGTVAWAAFWNWLGETDWGSTKMRVLHLDGWDAVNDAFLGVIPSFKELRLLTFSDDFERDEAIILRERLESFAKLRRRTVPSFEILLASGAKRL